MGGRRWVVVGVLVVLAACGDHQDTAADGRPTSASAGASSEVWEMGERVGIRYGPFADAFRLSADGSGPSETGDWFVVVVPSGDPVEGFFAVVEDAVDRGFPATVREDGPCWQEWQRDEVPFGADGAGDGEGFTGAAPFGAPLPAGAEAIGVDCRAVLQGGGAVAEVSMRASLGEEVDSRPAHPVVVIRSRAGAVPATEFARQDLPFDVPGVDAPEDVLAFHLEAPGGEPWTSPGGCAAAASRSTGSPVEAVAAAMAASSFAEFLDGAPEERTTLGRPMAVHGQSLPGGGPVVVFEATETDSGSDVLTCTRH